MKRICLLFCFLLCFFVSDFAQATVADRKGEAKNSKIVWFQDAKFGMFIHWGVYSKLAGEWNGMSGYGEFVMMTAKIPISQYEQIAKSLNPVNFNAGKWVLAAKQAGMKYMVLTSKHHEGFAMFHSTSDPYNIVDFTAFKRDPVKELADACRKYGLKFGVYYSLGRDWHDPDVPTNWPTKGGRSNTWDFPNEDAKDFSKYFERKVKPQVKELMTQYHPAIFWFDTPELIQKEQSRELRELILKMDSSCIINERIGNGFGDYNVLEQKGGDKIIPGIWETCITMSKNWGYVKKDTVFKSSEKLIGLLVDAVSKGGNLLLNAGPTAEGELRSENLDRMQEMGNWLSVNGEAIYGTKPWKVFGENADESAYSTQQGFKVEQKDEVYDGTPRDVVPDIRFTTKGDKLYVITRSWRQKEVLIKSLTKNEYQVKSIAMLGYKGQMVWNQTEAGTTITIPANAVTKVPVYVFKLTLNEK